MKKKRITAGLLALFVLMCMVLSGCSIGDTENAASEARNGTVRILSYVTAYSEDLDMEIGSFVVTGSGFGIGEAGEETDTFVTNRHVIIPYDEEWSLAEICYQLYSDDVAEQYIEYFAEEGIDSYSTYYTISYELVRAYILLDDYAYSSASGLDTSRAVPCTVLYSADDDEADIAVIQASEVIEDRVALAISDSDDLSVGDSIYALGYPVDSDIIHEEGEGGDTDYAGSVERCTVTDGTVSTIANSSSLNSEIITHTAIVNSGNSGGPLINEDGAVVGINAYTYSDYSGAVSSAELIKVLKSEDIDYELYSDNMMMIIIIIIAAVVVAAGAAVLIILLVKKKNKKNRPAQQPVPDQFMSQQPPMGDPYMMQQPMHEPMYSQMPPQQGGPVVPNDSGLRFQALTGTFAGKRFAIGNEVRIGRDPARNDLIYPADTKGVSGVHCRLMFQNGRLLLQDLGSTYGTFLQGGQRLAANQAVEIHIGEEFYLASREELFVIVRSGE